MVFLPLHPIVLLAFLSYDTFVNTAGHTGYEIFPKCLSRHRLLKPLNTVTHHTNLHKTFGSFFNIWGRLMGTFSDESDEPEKPAHVRSERLDPVDSVHCSSSLLSSSHLGR